MRILVAAIASLLLQAPSAPPALDTYHDDGLRFTFSYPASFKRQPDELSALGKAASESPETLQPALRCTSTPLIAVNKPGPAQVELIMILRLDFGCMGRNVGPEVLEPMAVGSIRQGLRKIGPPILTKPVAYVLDGHEAVFVQASAPDASDGIPGHAGVACVLLVNTVACWSALTAYPSHLPQLFAATVSFDQRVAHPIVPAELIVRPAGPDPR